MFKNSGVAWATFGVAILLLAFLLWLQLRSPGAASPEQLAQTALSGGDELKCEEAAVQLSQHPARSLDLIRKVFAEAQSDRVKAAAALGLGALVDWESMPKLIDAMESNSPDLRGNASAAVTQITGRDFGFQPNADATQQARNLQIIAGIRKNWELYHKIYLAKHPATKPEEPKK